MNVTIIDPDGLVYIMLEQPSGTGASVCGGRDCRGVKSCTRACTILASPAGDYKYKVLLAGLDNIPVCPPEQKNAKGECLEKVSKEISISLATPMTGCLLNDCTGKKEGFTICDASNNKNIITCGKYP